MAQQQHLLYAKMINVPGRAGQVYLGMLPSCNELIERLMRLLTRLSGGFQLQRGRMSSR